MTLNEINCLEKARIVSFSCPSDIEHRLRALGMIENTIIDVRHKKKSGTMVINLRGTRFAIGRQLAASIEVSR